MPAGKQNENWQRNDLREICNRIFPSIIHYSCDSFYSSFFLSASVFGTIFGPQQEQPHDSFFTSSVFFASVFGTIFGPQQHESCFPKILSKNPFFSVIGTRRHQSFKIILNCPAVSNHESILIREEGVQNAGYSGRQVVGADQREAADSSCVRPADKGEFVAVTDSRPYPDLLGNHDLPTAVDREYGLNLAARIPGFTQP
jgi:hypothetical protein